MAKEFEWEWAGGADLYPGGIQAPALGVEHPRLMAFCIALQEPQFLDSYVDHYRDNWENDLRAPTLLDYIVVWLIYSDGFMWCPTYTSFLEAVIEIGTNWIDNDRKTVTHPRAEWYPPEELLPDHGWDGERPVDQKPLTGLDGELGGLASPEKLAVLLNQETFNRLRAVHAAYRTRP